jgi:hypothetical protein
MDETHYPREGIANWVWTAVQPLLAVFAICPSRARYVILDFIGQRCTAAVTTDRYAGYAFIDAERRRVCCTRPAHRSGACRARGPLPGGRGGRCWCRCCPGAGRRCTRPGHVAHAFGHSGMGPGRGR